jgi:hypothetical protein
MDARLLELMKGIPFEHFERLMNVQEDIKDRNNRGRLMQDNYLQTPNSVGLHSPVTQHMRTN